MKTARPAKPPAPADAPPAPPGQKRPIEFATTAPGPVVICITTALDRLTHFQGTSDDTGNYSEPMTEAVMTPAGRREVPMLSGNALRHLVREQAADLLCEAMGIADGSLDPLTLAFLYNGGFMDKGGGRVNVRRRRELDRIMPAQSMLGCSFRDDLMPGSMKNDAGMLVCAENADRLRRKFPTLAQSLFDGIDLPGQQELSGQYTYYSKVGPFPAERRVKLEALEAMEEKLRKKAFSPAPIGGGCVNPGAIFIHAYRLDRPDPLKLGALLLCLRSWAARSGTFGAMSARGHGRLDMRLIPPDGYDEESAVAGYRTHLTSHAAEAREFLAREFSGTTIAAEAS